MSQTHEIVQFIVRVSRKKKDREKSERGDFDMKHCFCHAVSFTDVFLRTTTATTVSGDNYSTNILLHQTTEFNCNAIFMANTDAVEKSISRNVLIYISINIVERIWSSLVLVCGAIAAIIWDKVTMPQSPT